MLTALTVLRLHSNQLAKMRELAHLAPLSSLTHLSLMRNPLSALEELQQQRKLSDTLPQSDPKSPKRGGTSSPRQGSTYPLVRWPAQSMSECVGQSNERVDLQRSVYRLRVLAMVPSLRQLDFVPVITKERLRVAAMTEAAVLRESRPQSSRRHPRDLTAVAALHQSIDKSEHHSSEK